MAKIDYMSRGSHNRKELLCATFINGALKPSLTLFANIDNTQIKCEWAVVVYDGDASTVCDPLRAKKNVVHCRLVPESIFDGLSMYGLNKSIPIIDKKTGKQRRPTIPKTILYSEVQNLLPSFKRVMLLDEDISLENFNTATFLQIWKCAFYPYVPLIVQPLIAENTQFLRYMNQQSWKDSGVVASASGLIEQQVPAFDSMFFEWFLRRVLPVTRSAVLENGVDWGHDRSWCNAAQMYASHVLNWPNSRNYSSLLNADDASPVLSACAILPGAPPVHHLNTRSMVSKRTQRDRYRKGGRAVVQEYINSFPTWVLLDISQGPDPLRQPRYKKVKQLLPTSLCPT